jgi:hypothetical protein
MTEGLARTRRNNKHKIKSDPPAKYVEPQASVQFDDGTSIQRLPRLVKYRLNFPYEAIQWRFFRKSAAPRFCREAGHLLQDAFMTRQPDGHNLARSLDVQWHPPSPKQKQCNNEK